MGPSPWKFTPRVHAVAGTASSQWVRGLGCGWGIAGLVCLAARRGCEHRTRVQGRSRVTEAACIYLPSPPISSFSGDSPETRCVTGRRGNPKGNSVSGASDKPKKARRTQKTSFPEWETRGAMCPGGRTGRRAPRRSRVRTASRVWRARLCRTAPQAAARPRRRAAWGSLAPSLERMLAWRWLQGPRQPSTPEPRWAVGWGLVRPGVARCLWLGATPPGELMSHPRRAGPRHCWFLHILLRRVLGPSARTHEDWLLLDLGARSPALTLRLLGGAGPPRASRGPSGQTPGQAWLPVKADMVIAPTPSPEMGRSSPCCWCSCWCL